MESIVFACKKHKLLDFDLKEHLENATKIRRQKVELKWQHNT